MLSVVKIAYLLALALPNCQLIDGIRRYGRSRQWQGNSLGRESDWNCIIGHARQGE